MNKNPGAVMRTSQKIAVGASFTFITLFLVGLTKLKLKDAPTPRAQAMMATALPEAISLNESSSKAVVPAPSARAGHQAPAFPSNNLALDAMATSQKLIRTGALTLEVQAFDGALGRLQQIAAEQGGYLADLRANRKEAGQAQGTVVIRVAPARYFLALDQMRGLGKVEAEAIQTQDVTRAYADLEARLHNKRDLENRMREILRTRTSNLATLIEAESKLSEVTEEIERMEGERRYYQQMTGLSTITLELHEPLVAAPQFEHQPPPLWAPVRQAYRESLAALVQATALAVSALVFLLPWSLLGWLGWRVFRKFRPQSAPLPSRAD